MVVVAEDVHNGPAWVFAGRVLGMRACSSMINDLLLRGCLCDLREIIWMRSMPLGFGKHEDDHDQGETDEAGVEPPEVPPSQVQTHGAADNLLSC